MNNIGKSGSRVIEKVPVSGSPVTMPLAGTAIKIDYTPSGPVLHVDLDALPKTPAIQPDFSKVHGKIAECSSQVQIQSDKLHQLELDSIKRLEEAKIELVRELVELKNRPAQVLETRIVEQPGETIREIKHVVPAWMWLTFALLTLGEVVVYYVSNF